MTADPADPAADRADLLVEHAELVATVDDERREIPGGWVAVTGGFVSGVGPPGSEPEATRVLDASGCLVTPGLVNTHHHIFQNLTRAYRPALGGTLFDWLRTLYPLFSRIDEEAVYLSAWVGLAELAAGGCTCSTDHLYVHPTGAGDLLGAEITAARELGFRFHPTRGSMSLSEKDGGLPPDSVVQNDDTILAESEAAVARHHDPAPGAMVRIALAPCSPFTVTTALLRATAELAERLDVRLHTHLAEVLDEDDFCVETFGMRPVDYAVDTGWMTDRTWLAHFVHPNTGEIGRAGRAGVCVAHCPSSNMILGSGLAPVSELRAAGVPVGLGCDGSASADSASLWQEARLALLQGRLRAGQAGTPPGSVGAREVLEMATRGGAACLGREGELGQLAAGAAGDLVAWRLDGLAFSGAVSDPVEAWLRGGPTSAWHTVIAGRPLIEAGELTVAGLDGKLADHRRAAEAVQRPARGPSVPAGRGR